MKVDEKKHAIRLRKAGYSYSDILKEVSVSKSTLSSWLSDIKYRPNREVVNRVGKSRLIAAKRKVKEKEQSIKRAQKIAKKDIGSITKRDLFMLGIGLYIGEGAKTQNIVRIINSDPEVIKLAIKWFTEVCNLSIENFRLAIHLYPDNNISSSLNFWAEQTGIPREQFGKVQVDRRTSKKKGKRGKLQNGTAHLTIRANGEKNFGTFLSRRIGFWMKCAMDKSMRV